MSYFLSNSITVFVTLNLDGYYRMEIIVAANRDNGFSSTMHQWASSIVKGLSKSTIHDRGRDRSLDILIWDSTILFSRGFLSGTIPTYFVRDGEKIREHPWRGVKYNKLVFFFIPSSLTSLSGIVPLRSVVSRRLLEREKKAFKIILLIFHRNRYFLQTY